MRSYACILLWSLAAAPTAAQSSFSDLVQTIKPPQPGGMRTVTLDLARVPTKMAVSRLAEAAHLVLKCTRELADRKVSVLAREQNAADIAEGVARAVDARWRKEGDALLLEAAPLVQLLRPEEITIELHEALKRAGAMATAESQSVGAFQSLFTAQQAAALESGQALRASQLSPRQREALALPLLTRIAATLLLAQTRVSQAKDLDPVTVSVWRRDGVEWLDILRPKGGFMLQLPSSSGQR